MIWPSSFSKLVAQNVTITDLCTIPDFLTRPNFVCFRKSHWGFYRHFHLRERASDWGSNVLRKVDALMDWSLVSPRMKGGLNWSGLAPPGYHEIVLFKCLLIGQWHGLSDSKLEESLRVRFDALPFAALDLHCTVRGETTHYRFRSDTAWSCHA